MKLQPTLHKPVPMNTRVIVPTNYLGVLRGSYGGIVVGISSCHVIFTYIVLLDEPAMVEDEICRAIVVDGANLMDENGHYAWRLDA